MTSVPYMLAFAGSMAVISLLFTLSDEPMSRSEFTIASLHNAIPLILHAVAEAAL